MARIGSRGALATTLAVAAVAGSGLLAYALWPDSALTGVTAAAGPPPPTVGRSPDEPLALTPPSSAVAGSGPQASAAPTTTAPPPPATTSSASTGPPTPPAPAVTTAPVKVAPPMCATLPTSSGAVLGPGCYVEVSLDHPSIAWPSGTSTSSEQIVKGEVWDGLSVAGVADASGVNLVVTLANHSTQTMVFPDGLAVSLTVAAAGAPAVHIDLTDRSATTLAPGGSLRLPGTAALTLPGVYGLGATVGFSIV